MLRRCSATRWTKLGDRPTLLLLWFLSAMATDHAYLGRLLQLPELLLHYLAYDGHLPDPCIDLAISAFPGCVRHSALLLGGVVMVLKVLFSAPAEDLNLCQLI